MTTYTNGQWLIGAFGDDYWRKVNAATLTGAKRCATNMCQMSVGAKIRVARAVGDADQQQIVVVSCKMGYGNWFNVF